MKILWSAAYYPGGTGQNSDTGCEEETALILRAAGPFNKPKRRTAL